MKKIRAAVETFTLATAALGAVAKIRKDFLTHGEHRGEHNPCSCSDTCLLCLKP